MKHALVSAEWARLEGRDAEASTVLAGTPLGGERGFLQDMRSLANWQLDSTAFAVSKGGNTYLDEARDGYVPGAPVLRSLHL